MVKILTEVSNEFAAVRRLSGEAQSQLLSVQDILARTTDRCFESQKADMRNRSWVESAFQGTSAMCALSANLVADGELNKVGLLIARIIPMAGAVLKAGVLPPLADVFSKAGQSAGLFYFEPRKLDHENLMRKTDSSAQQTHRQVTALDSLRQTLDQLEQQLQSQRQTATTA